MAKLKDLAQILGSGHELPINGKTYNIPYVDAETGLKFAAYTALAVETAQAMQEGRGVSDLAIEQAEILNDDEELDLYTAALTADVYAEMKADGLPFEYVKFAATYVLIYSTMGETQAAEYWATGGKAPRRNRAARRTETPTRTGAARTTRKRG